MSDVQMLPLSEPSRKKARQAVEQLTRSHYGLGSWSAPMSTPRIYKVTTYEGERFWVLRLPSWIGWLRDRYNKLRYGFVP